MHFLRGIALTVLLGACAMLPGQTREEDAKHCMDSNPDVSIGGCTALIQSGQLTNYNLANAFNNRGLSYHVKGEYDRAIQDYDQAIRLNPGYAYAFFNRGIAYKDKGEYDRAIQDYDQAIKLDPVLAIAFFSRGNVYRVKGEYDRAIQDYDQAIKLNPGDADAFRSRGAAHFFMGEFAAAEPDFAEALKANPGDAYSALWLFLAQARAGKDGSSVLKQRSSQIKLTAWPGQAIELYLGAATPAAVLSAAGDKDLNKSRNQHCEAYFFLAEKALLGGDRAKAMNLFQQSLDTGAFTEMQYSGAQAELKRLRTPVPGAVR
jgi:lipoprotein NlpI